MSHDHSLNPKIMPNNPERATLEGRNKFMGFWFFLGGETVLFASLFGVYLALKNSTAGGPSSEDLFGLGLVFLMTVLLLTSSLTSVYAMYHMRNNDFKKMQLWLGITGLLGIGFLACEDYEFAHYIIYYRFTLRSVAFGSAFCALGGFHGGHLTFGIVSLIVLMIRNAKRGLKLYNGPKFNSLSLYCPLIDVVWVLVVT